ncbi:hypothetical protein [Ewingella americana]|uniref:Lipoprotein n=1 Tax=Ewingella americana TaxID=41202 RepID=A0A502GAC7_9GAMM|nr:hypothetical protein [Ewingella americana]TPG58270.1 hypothetical protein EAH77_18665 [Ewingella americana]
MIHRFSLAVAAAAIVLTGCAKHHATGEPAENFASGDTLVTVTHVHDKTDDGTTVFVTVDGTDAAALAIGQSVDLHVPAGAHKVGGYARTLIGRVTIAPVEVTTAADSAKHVAYTVTKNKPAFSELSNSPKQPEQPQNPPA